MTTPTRKLIRPALVAEMCDVSEGTLKRWRAANEGPPSYLIGGNVKYVEAEVEEWLEAQMAMSRKGGAA